MLRADSGSLYFLSQEGVVAKAGDMLFIYPMEEQQQHRHVQGNREDEQGNREDERPYVVEKISPTAINFSDYIVSDSISRGIPEGFRRVRRGTKKMSYDVELMMVTDSSVYSFWYERTTASTPAERRTLTLSKITQYYAFVLNAIDLRYKNINETDLALNVLYSGLLIVEDPSVSNWTDGIAKNNTDGGKFPLVDADLALTSFTTWVQGRTDLPQSDHVMLFTAYDIFYDGKTKNAGLAFLGAICGENSTSIIENWFNFNGATVAAHELGHSLGAVHDGDQNPCQANDSFIMAADSGQSTDATAQNPWYFSPCSVSDFRKQIETLDIEANNCLLTQSPDLDPTALTPLLQIPPGQKYSVDTQCAYFLGNGSTFCRSLYSEASYPELCGGMFCSIPGTDRCGKTVPARGTSCGPNKWCESGACVYSAEAPDVQASCPFGEYTGIIGEVDMTCAELIQFLRVACYREDFSQRCCESCPSIQSGIPNCQYGDWAEDCSISDCANPDSLEVCCKTCYEANATQPTTTANVPSRTTAPKTTEAIPSTAIKTPPTTITVSKPPTTVLSTTTYNPTDTTAAPTATASITRSATTMSTATKSATQPATTVPSTTTTDEVNPDTFPWGEWAGIIAGMLVLLVLAPALACCLVKCRRQPKDPMDTISNKGDVEITKFNPPPVYMNRTHQPGYGWTGNQTSQQTQPDEGNEAEHGFAPANKKTKSITTEKDGETSWIVNNAFLDDD